MDSNNHFNYGTHSSANSGLKLSSGDSLYTNGSSMSFPQQGKNMNGEMNVNGVTTVLGSSVPGSHPPSAPYPHLSNHHQSSVGYDYLWGGHPQYGPAVSNSPAHGMHQKQSTPGMVQPQSQHHFQGHGQYQLNGGIESSHQAPVAGPANMPLTGNQYWNRSNPGTQQMSYNSHGMYGTYQSQAHPGITPSQHHQQQSLQHPSLSSPQQQQQQPPPQQQTQPQAQAQMMPPAPQNFTPPRGSPQHHSLGRGSTGSPLPVGMSSAQMMSPSAVQDSGSPKGHSRERRHARETVREVDTSYNGSDRSPVAQRLPKTDSHQSKPPAAHVGPPSDYRQLSEQPAAQRPEMSSPVRDPAVNPPPQSQLSVSAAPAFSGSPTSEAGPTIISSPDVESTSPQISTPPSVSFAPSPTAAPRLSSPPLMVQGLRPPPPGTSDISPAGSKHLLVGSSSTSSLPVSPSKQSKPLASTDSLSRPAAVSSGPPVSSSLESAFHQKPATVSGPPVQQSPPSIVSASTYSAPSLLVERQMVQESKPPSMPPRFSDASGGQHEKPGPPKLISDSVAANSSLSRPSTLTPPGPCSLTSASPSSVEKTPLVGSEPASTLQGQKYTPQAVDSGLSIASSPPGGMNLPSITDHVSPTVRPLSTLPLLTTQASRTAPLPSPPALVSVPPVTGTSSGVVQSSDIERHPPNTAPPCVLKQSPSKSEHHGHCEDRKALADKGNENAEEHLPLLDSGLVRMSHLEATESHKSESQPPKSLSELPGKTLQTTLTPDQKPKNGQTDSENHHMPSDGWAAEDCTIDQVPLRKSPHLSRTSFANSSHPAPQYDGNSTCNTPSGISVHSTLEKTSLLGGDSSCIEDSTHFDNSFHMRKGNSQFDNTSCAEEEPSSIFDNSVDSSFSVEDSRDNTLDSTREGETSEAEETRNSCEITGESVLDWKREIRVKKMENRMKGETWYYTPCGRRMKQFPEIVKYLKKHTDSVVTREHFSFSPRMPVGDFYEERETPEGVKWVLLANEEVPSMIMAITGRRGRPPNPDKEKPRRVRGLKGGQVRRPGRPPKPKMIDFLSKVDAKLLKRLEAKEALTEEEKEKLAKIKKKMKRKQEAQQLEAKAEPTDPSAPQASQPASESAAEPKNLGRRRSIKVEPTPPVQQTDTDRVAQGKRVLGARSKAKALAKAQAEAEAAAQAVLAAKRAAERRAQAQRRMEERKRQQLIAEELKKPTEDMCLTDHKPLPELSRIPGVVLSGTAFAHCLAVVEFLHGYGKVIGLNIPKDIPSLATLQEGLLGLGDSQGELQDLLIKLVEAALHDPGLPSYYQSVKILGEKLVELELTRSTVSEVLRIFLESHGYETEVCNTLRTKPFHALPPDTKAAILGFLVEELNSSNTVINDIDNTVENMTTYRKNKWIIEGKLRKLKAVLSRRTGRSEEELCFEERRRSARVAEEENLSLEESGVVVLERGNRRARKEEPKLSDSESPTNASIPELERQIDKLTKRQAFFRKKLLQSSHSMRAILLGQDRYRRRYLALPHLGGVLVEGPEELLSKSECKLEYLCFINPQLDPLPGTASLMSRPRGRGRPRKIKPEVELHLRTAKIRRRRRSSVRSRSEEGPGSPNSGTQDLTQAAFQSWLSQSQEAVMNGTCSSAGEAPEGNRPEESVKEMAEKQGQWFNLLPKQPCDDNSLTELQTPTSPTLQDIPPTGPDCAVPASSPPTNPQILPTPNPPAPSTPATPARPARRRRRGSRGSSPARRGPRGAAAKRRGRPPNSVFQELEQQYFTQLVVKPIPASMVRGWWWIKTPEELYNTLQSLHPRGIREKVLHKHLAKHMESLAEICTKPINDPMFELKVEEKDALLEALQQPWQVQEKTMETDISALQWVEDLEQRVIAADLHLKVENHNLNHTIKLNHYVNLKTLITHPDSTRDDLQYYEHDADPRDDWIVRTKKEWSGLPRIATHPLDLGVLRLANLERNIERRYLKEPLWNPAEVMRLAPLTPTPGEEHPMDVISLESEITSRLRTWRQALDRCRSAPQLCLCLLQLEKAIAWERSVTKVTCQVCKKGDNDECLLLCDGCDRGCHMYCLRPKITQIPEGDWFCPTCVAKDEDDSLCSSKKRTRVKKRRYEDDSSEDEVTTRRSGGMTTRHKDVTPPSSSSRHSGEGSSAKRRRMTTRNQPDLTFCEIILMEMEAHADAWPFLEPVNPRLVPGYRRIIKNPMDFLTMRERLLQGGYLSCEEFAADAQLVFNNCELFNEDTSEVGMAGHSMRRFFESRWAEFYSNKDK
uniref:Bromodomain adjacent to zinc finger domain, 2A n=1 Tax=Oreochromis niloticus TaxID=8128 RepID=I3KK72_ORENI